MPRLLLVRHAQSEWNALGRWQGWADPPLSAVGRSQAATAGQALRDAGLDVDVVISSDLLRASQSATGVADVAFPDAPRLTEGGWREYRVGAWSGLTRSEIEQGWPGVLARYDQGDLSATPGGEDREAFAHRLSDALGDALQRTERTALVVSHGGSIRAVGRLLGWPVDRVSNLSGLLIEGDAGAPPPKVVGTVDLLGPGLAAVLG